MNDKHPGKLKYINGIPYLTGRHVQLEEAPSSRTERLMLAWQGLFGPRLAGPALVCAIVLLVVGIGGLIDYLLVVMPRNAQ